MIDRCVCCGDIIPEGRQVCSTCEKHFDNPATHCPDCEAPLIVMNTSRYFTDDGFGYSTLFHCTICHSDWEKESEYIAKPVQFKRKFWG